MKNPFLYLYGKLCFWFSVNTKFCISINERWPIKETKGSLYSCNAQNARIHG